MDDESSELTSEECWDFLRSSEFGRLAFHLGDEVHIVPVNYAVDGETLLIRTAEGSKLLGVVMNEDCAFEIDEFDDDEASSVVVRGRARVLGEDEEHRADRLGLRAWVGAFKYNVVEISPTEVSGRRFALDRTPTSLEVLEDEDDLEVVAARSPEREVLELDALDIDEIASALEDQEDYEHCRLIDPDTGEIFYWTSDTGIDGQNPVHLEDLDLLAIDPVPTYVWYQDMVDFSEQLSDSRCRARLARALDGRGAFRRFRAELGDEYPELISHWRAFHQARAYRRAVDWLRSHGLVSLEAAEQYAASHPDPDLP